MTDDQTRPTLRSPGPFPAGRMAAPEAIPSHRAEQLTAGGPTATILHEGQAYTLRITRTGKLILTK